MIRKVTWKIRTRVRNTEHNQKNLKWGFGRIEETKGREENIHVIVEFKGLAGVSDESLAYRGSTRLCSQTGSFSTEVIKIIIKDRVD